MFNDNRVKVAAYESGLSQVMHRCWTLCDGEDTLTHSVLALLTTYVAHCPQGATSSPIIFKPQSRVLECVNCVVLSACRSLAFTHALSSEERPSEKQQHSSNSLVHCAIRHVPRCVATGNTSALKSTFSLLATLSLSSECRGILWKVMILPYSI